MTRNYKTQLRSIQALMREQFYELAQTTGSLSKALIELETQEELKLLEENDLENKRIARVREAKWAREISDSENELFDKKMSIEEGMVKDSLQLDEHIS